MRVIKALVLSLPAVGMTLGGISAVVALNAVASAPVYAADKKTDKQVSPKVGKPLKEAQELVAAGKLKEAMAKVQEAATISGKTPFDDFKIAQFTAFIATKAGDYATAAKAYESSLQSGELPSDQVAPQQKQLTLLYYQLKNYPKSIQYGTQYLKDTSDAQIALLIAQSYYLQKDYQQAIASIQSVIRMAEQGGQPVQKEWLDLLRSAQQLAGKDDDAAATLGVLLSKYPSQEYWRDTFIIEQNKSSGSSDRKNLETLRLKMMTGVLKDSDYVEMAQYAFSLGFPGDAKMILDKGFANKILGAGANKDRENRLLAKAQTDSAADQKDLAVFEKEAIAKPTGDADIKLGQTYVSYGDYDKGIEAMKRGLKKGNLKAEDEAHLTLGIAYVNTKKTSDAVAQFKAVPADSKLASLARLWIIYANSKG